MSRAYVVNVPKDAVVYVGPESFSIEQKKTTVRSRLNPHYKREKRFYTFSHRSPMFKKNFIDCVQDIMHFSKKEIKRICRGVGGRLKHQRLEFDDYMQAAAFADVLFLTMVITQRIPRSLDLNKIRGYVPEITSGQLCVLNPLLKITGRSMRNENNLKTIIFYHRALKKEYPFDMPD
jgi:hypothetical protein